jgi:hypothetical protein
VVLWATAAFVLLGGHGRVDPFGSIKGTDFVHFYTLGHVARAHDAARLYDNRALYALQVELVPESARDRFLSVYPPQTGLLFAPLAALSYDAAAVVWMMFTAAIFGCAVWLAWRPARHVLTDRVLVAAAAAGFPPFWNLILYGQTTAVPIAAFLGCWLALERGHRVLAGLALGLLFIKPQWGLVVAVVLVARGEWLMIAGVALSLALQLGGVVVVFGPSTLPIYIDVLKTMSVTALEPKPFQLHSLKTLSDLLPSPGNLIVWSASAAATAALAVRVWRPSTAPAARVALRALASALVNPHLNIYDVTVLALPLMWLGAEVEASRPQWRGRYWAVVYGLIVTLLVPTALFIDLQLSVVAIAAIFGYGLRLHRRPPLTESPA